MKNILSVDVEEWFHLLELDSTPKHSEWNKLESRIEKNFHTLLDLFDEKGAKATFFCLGWVAERYPHLLREADQRGHEIASHGNNHQLIYTQTREEFYADIKTAKNKIEDSLGKEIKGYRAPGFSVVASTPWAYEEIAHAGYAYDSSLFPAKRGHGGLAGGEKKPHRISTSQGEIVEFPISVADLLGQEICFFGGGYLRLFPYFLIKRMAKKVNEEGRPVVFYVHPREIDPEHPRIPMGPGRRFKSYINLKTTLPKLSSLAESFKLVSFQDWLASNKIEKLKPAV